MFPMYHLQQLERPLETQQGILARLYGGPYDGVGILIWPDKKQVCLGGWDSAMYDILMSEDASALRFIPTLVPARTGPPPHPPMEIDYWATSGSTYYWTPDGIS